MGIFFRYLLENKTDVCGIFARMELKTSTHPLEYQSANICIGFLIKLSSSVDPKTSKCEKLLAPGTAST